MAIASLLVTVISGGCRPSDVTIADSNGPTEPIETDAPEPEGSTSAAQGSGSTGEPPPDPFAPDPSWERWEIRFPDYAVPAQETTYACYTMSFSPDQPVHVVAFEPVIDDSAVVHHMILSRTTDPAGLVEPCYPSPEGATAAHWGWAPGVTPLVVPNEAGFLVGDEPGPVHYVLQIHYDNGALEAGHVDASGVNVYNTRELRPENAGIALLGDVANLVIPPGQPDWETIHYCNGDSTRLLLQRPVHVFGSWLHAHRLATALRTDQLRGGDEMIGALGRHEPYDFDNQRFEPLDAVIEPGDTLVTHCFYDSSDLTEHTYGGGGTDDEMCLNYLLYYPKQPFFIYCNEA